ncbi:MAG: thioredoxin [Ignavibacteriae bacterium]|nr:thioredoxin [Ignavibacteriota bacterium]
MKLILFFFITSSLFAQNYKLVEDVKSKKIMLIGISTREAFEDSNFAGWFNVEYKNYLVDTNLINNLKSEIVGKKIKIVLGTWCSDSRREVPRFFKILDSIGFCDDNLTIINVDRTKNGLTNETVDLNIEFVPTFIILEDDEEIGRIIETPNETLEKDLFEIID